MYWIILMYLLYVHIWFGRTFQSIGYTISFFQWYFLINCNMENVTLFNEDEEGKQINKIDKKYWISLLIDKWLKDKIHLKLFTWTPSNLSTKIWLLFLLTRSIVIESEDVFSVCGTISYGDLLGSTFRHRLFYAIYFN